MQGISADASGYWRFECELPQKHDSEAELLKEWRSRLNGTHVQLLWVRIGRNRSAAAPVSALFRVRPGPASNDSIGSGEQAGRNPQTAPASCSAGRPRAEGPASCDA